MATFRTYQKLHAQVMSGSTFDWGGTAYGDILHMAGEDIPDSVAVSNTTHVIGVGTNTTSSLVIGKDFILPYPLDTVSVINGVISGAFKVTIYGAGTNSTSMSTLREVKLQLKAIDSDGNERDITDELSLWSGLLTASSGNTYTVAEMFWVDVDVQIEVNERLVMRFECWGHAGAYVGNAGIASFDLYHAKNTDELSITLPMVI